MSTDTAAFFDVDNTMMRGASIFQLAKALHQRNMFSLRDIAVHTLRHARFLSTGENMDDVHSIRDAALSFGKGLTVEWMREFGEEVYDELISSRIWPQTQQLAQDHLAAGHRVWLVTATPQVVAEVISDRLGLTGAIGTQAEHVDGAYTGKLVGEIMHGPEKAIAVRRLAAVEGIDLNKSYAYSDSHNDLPLLSLVGKPRVVNPDRKLAKYARSRDWPVHDFRTRGRLFGRGAAPEI